MKPFEYPEPFWELDETSQRYYDTICKHLDSYILEPIDSIMLTMMVTQISVFVRALKDAKDHNVVGLAQDGAMEFVRYFEVLKYTYGEFIEMADKFYITKEQCDRILTKELAIEIDPKIYKLLNQL